MPNVKWTVKSAVKGQALAWLKRRAKAKNAGRAFDEYEDGGLLPHDPAMQHAAQAHLKDLKKQFEKGDQSVLLRAINTCVAARLVLPEWAEREWLKRFKLFTDFEVRTLDEAFNVERKGLRLVERKERETRKLEIVNGLFDAFVWEDYPISVEGFDALVGRFQGMSAATLRDYWYDKDDEWTSLKRQFAAKIKGRGFSSFDDLRDHYLANMPD
jgi:hypothetical protein